MPQHRRCVFGCAAYNSLFPFPCKDLYQSLRTKWLEFTHFEETGVFNNSRLCDNHFSDESFENKRQFSEGFATYLQLSKAAIPSIYTVGNSLPQKPSTRDFWCQCVVEKKSIKLQIKPSYTHRRSKATQITPKTRSVSTWMDARMPDQCGIEDPLPIHTSTPTATPTPTPTSTPVYSKRPRFEAAEQGLLTPAAENVECMDSTETQTQSDSTHVPDDCLSHDVTGVQDLRSTPMYSAKKYIVFEDNLLQLLNTCPTCTRKCTVEKHVIGTFLSVTQICLPCKHRAKWQSQPYIGNLAAGNILLSAAVAFNGASFTQVHKVLSSLRLQSISPRTHYRHQSAYLQPTILHQWRMEQAKVIDVAKGAGKPITLGGDMRADSPGYSAKYGSYTMMDLDHNKILDIQLVQSNEPYVRYSNNMELAGFKRSLTFLESAGLTVGALVTDRHKQIGAYMKRRLDIQHFYDAWHVAKGLSKKLEALGKERDCEVIQCWRQSATNHLYWSTSSSQSGEEAVAKWTSITNHIQNVHQHNNALFPNCAHGVLTDRAWLLPNTKACERFCAVMLKGQLLKDVAKVSPRQQTSSIESFHSLILRFAPKNVVFPFIGMLCRLLLACLHYNANADRQIILQPDGKPKVKVRFPKFKKGEPSIAFVKPKPTYDYVDTLQQLLGEVVDNPLPFQQKRDAIEVPPALSAGYKRPDPQTALSRWSRFAPET